MNTFDGFIKLSNYFMIAVIIILVIGLIIGLLIYFKSKKLENNYNKIECLKCHNYIDNDSEYCKYCGKRVKHETD